MKAPGPLSALLRSPAPWLVPVALALGLAASLGAQDATPLHKEASQLQDEEGRPGEEAERQVSSALRRALDRSDFAVKRKGAGLLDVGDGTFGGFKLKRSDEEWRRLLSPDQFRVARLKLEDGVHAPVHTGHGSFACTCGNPLFHSDELLESTAGRLSFRRPVAPAATVTDVASAWSAEHTEVELLCSMCGAHLGHVDPGAEPKDPIRFRIHPTALVFTAEADGESR